MHAQLIDAHAHCGIQDDSFPQTLDDYRTPAMMTATGKEPGMPTPDLPVIPARRIDDLHNLKAAADCDLALFVAGNQFMVMPELLAAFRSTRPQVERIYYETLPPGLELRQILAGGAHFRGQVLTVRPDVYASVSRQAMETLETAGRIDPGAYRLYLHNRLTLMVPPGNPAAIRTVADLGRDEVRISQPDPLNEDIAFHIIDMYRQDGGPALVERIMEEKRAEGTTILTVVHHRETPLRIRKGTVDVGPVWATEAAYARTTDLAFEEVEPGEKLDQRDGIRYYVCALKDAPHPENAAEFVSFLTSETARGIYRRHGFVPPAGGGFNDA